MTLLVGATLLFLLLPGTGTPQQDVPPAEEQPQTQLAKRHLEFIDQAAMLMSEEEKRVFLALSEDYRRDAYQRRFWKVRDPYPETARNEFLDRFEENLREAKNRFQDLKDGRARFLMLYGPPQQTFRSHCELLRPLEIWHFSSSERFRHEFFAVFIRAGGRHQLWSPREGLRPLLVFSASLNERDASQQISTSCARGDDVLSALALSPDWEKVEAEGGLLPRPNDEWALSFLASSAEVPAGSQSLPAEMAVDFVGRNQSRTVVQTTVLVEPGGAIPREVEGRQSMHFLLDGEVVRNDELFESFRYRFDLPLTRSADTEAEAIPVLIERALRPGLYDLVVRLQDLESGRYFHGTHKLDVPRWQPKKEPVLAPARSPTTAADQPEPPVDSDEPGTPAPATIRLTVPNEELLTGRVRVEAFTQGEGIARVSFELDGRAVISKARPPFSVELDVGRAPQTHTVSAIALDSSRSELARDTVRVNSGPNRFRIRLLEPQPGRTYSRSVRATAEVDVPRLERLDRVEFYLNDLRVATLFQPPFMQPISIPADQPLSYVRVVGVLEGGGAVEDVVFVNAPDLIDELDVHFVELYTTVADRKGRPVEGLGIDDFSVTEDGDQQALRRFELVRDLPIHAGVLIDTSTSMVDRLEEAEEAAQHFFDLVLTPSDRACLFTFNDRHELVVPFTSSTEVLAGGLSGLVSEGETALYDSLIHTLYYFNGIRGKRTLILLSDGADSNSSYQYNDVLEYAKRSGVAIYSIGLSIDMRDIDIRSKLNRLCDQTGGRCFFVDEAKELKSVYGKIERELRSQYLLAYQSGSSKDGEFREVTVKVKKPGLRARTSSGYYP